MDDTELDPITAGRLAESMDGRVVLPGDEDYDAMRRVFLGNIDRRPAAITRPTSAADVSRVVRFAAEQGAELAVRGGGHSSAGHGVTEGGIVLDLRDLTGLDLDLQGRSAWAGGGMTAGAYTTAVGEHGLATGFGDMGTVGIGGITLAGGIGYLVRSHGLTIDSLLGAEVVTADGEILTVDADSHPDLFWAIRGGGGNFGVATRLRFRLHEVGTVLGGMLILPATPDVVEGAVALAEEAPDELTVMTMVMKAPPMPFLPPQVHGKMVALLGLVHVGSVEEGERVVAPFRDLAEPLVDQVAPMPYPDIFPPEGEEEFRPRLANRTMFADGLDAAQAAGLVERVEAATAPMAGVQLRVLGGAMSRVPAGDTAFPHRDRKLMAIVNAAYMDPAQAADQQAWVDDLWSLLKVEGDDSGYTGFLRDEGQDRVRAAYPGATWGRLAEIKRRYDPDNVFHLNHNIPPSE